MKVVGNSQTYNHCISLSSFLGIITVEISRKPSEECGTKGFLNLILFILETVLVSHHNTKRLTRFFEMENTNLTRGRGGRGNGGGGIL